MELQHKIGDNRAKHIMSVASMCYTIAKEKGLEELDCKKAFMVGYLHDVGYAFSKYNKEHPTVGCELLELCGDISDEILNAIKYHGTPDTNQTTLLQILNEADMQVNGLGEVVSICERIEDIGNRYGIQSSEYLNACKIANQIL